MAAFTDGFLSQRKGNGIPKTPWDSADGEGLQPVPCAMGLCRSSAGGQVPAWELPAEVGGLAGI